MKTFVGFRSHGTKLSGSKLYSGVPSFRGILGALIININGRKCFILCFFSDVPTVTLTDWPTSRLPKG